MMDITRNQWFLIGLVLLLLGIQFRLVESFELTAKLTTFLAQRSTNPVAAAALSAQSLAGAEQPIVKKRVRPPDWLGYSLFSCGAVLILHSWAMKKETS